MIYSPAAKAIIKKWEGFGKVRTDGKVQAYPDPGSPMGRGTYPVNGPLVAKGAPWTIGYGTTGPGITRGTIWTIQECETAFAKHIAQFSAAVDKLVTGHPTTQAQFDALVSFAYNVGTDALAGSTLLKKHRAGDFAAARLEFGKWINSGGRPVEGLKNRRAEEAALYAT